LQLVNAFGCRTAEKEERAWQSLTRARFRSRR
jgi:hypothetical protein